MALPDDDGAPRRRRRRRRCSSATERGGALVLGPGLGRSDGALAFARELARARRRRRCVLDADGLNAHAGRARGRSPRARAPTVLTPHAGELGAAARRRLRRGRARGACTTRARRRARAQAVVVLKGDDTLVAAPERRASAVSPRRAPALATAGTGDVLSGVIGALLAKGMDPFARRLRRRAPARARPAGSRPPTRRRGRTA